MRKVLLVITVSNGICNLEQSLVEFDHPYYVLDTLQRMSDNGEAVNILLTQ